MKNTFDFNEFRRNGSDFLHRLTSELKQMGFLPSHLKADHLCFRVQTLDEYTFYKNALINHAELLTESPVNGRAIATFKMSDGFKDSEGNTVHLVELPAPKVGTHYPTAFEHVEFVINESFEFFQRHYPHCQFRLSGQKNLNPELCLQILEGQAKFHHLPLNRVIEIEKAQITDIIFDFDGTLIQSREQIYNINSVVFSEVCQRPVSIQEAKEKFHPEFAKLFLNFEVHTKASQEQAILRWGQVSQSFEFPLFESTANILRKLKDKNKNLHLWTARDEESSLKILRAHNLEALFTTLSFASSHQSKPHADSLCFDWKSAPLNTMIMLGDSPSDIKGSKNINAIAAGAIWDPESDLDALLNTGAELIFHNLVEFHDWLLPNT